MRRIDLVAIDVDGTLLTDDKKLSRRAVHAVKLATKKGVRVVLASARPPRSLKQVAHHLGLETYQVSYNGALIHDPVRKRHVHHQPLASTIARKIIKLARSMDERIVVSVEILDKWYTDHVDETLPTETSKAFTPDFIGPLDAFLHVPVTKLMLLGQPAWLPPVRAAIERKFRGQIAIAISDTHLIQIVHPKVDKSFALEHVAERYKVARQHVMAIGDAPNDIGMLQWAGLGVAVGNAWESVRAAAKVVVPRNDEDGVAHAIRRYVLEN
jgi:5-amino-6-(5-phospho-D-ribitylamino)uracil phosphatase